jgi:ketosteroid isomerase-like protein
MTENSTNEHVVRRLFDALDAGDEAAVDELLAPDFVLHTAAPGYSPDGRGLKALAVDWRAVMPDWQQHLEELTTVGDTVAVRFTGSGTRQGAVVGAPPCSVLVTMTGTAEYRVLDGMVVECRGEYSMTQLVDGVPASRR